MGLVFRHQAGHVGGVAGGEGRVARPGEHVPDVAERLGVVIHHQHADPLPSALPGRFGNAGDLLSSGQGEGEPGAPARAVALGPDAAPVGLDDPLAWTLRIFKWRELGNL